VIAAAAALLLRIFIIEGIYVASGSMEPTLILGTNLLLEKVVLRFRAPRRGDIVVFPSPVEPSKDLIKRVIGLPGDTIEIRSKSVFLNGGKLSENYIKHTRPRERLLGDTIAPITVPEGMVFVMGDNRDESRDSRDWKNTLTNEPIRFVAIKRLKGRVIGGY
jgi:signal peptidase I